MSSRRDALRDHMAAVVRELRIRASTGTFNGRLQGRGRAYFLRCRYEDNATATRLIFTRDTGHHTSGWLKNPDYERCWHLSLSAIPSVVYIPGLLAELDKPTTRAWVEAFFGEHVSKVWAEAPFSPEGKAVGVWHWRLFCDAHWQPIIPRKEVYSREFTEAGWRSATQVLAEAGWYTSTTEDGRIIESTVDPR